MQVNTQSTNDSNIKLTITAFDTDLGTVKQAVLQKLAPKVKVAGFREGKVPLSLVEKNLEPSYLQSEFLDAAINYLYSQAISQEALRVVSRPKVELSLIHISEPTRPCH
jgi:trigger factor